MVAPLAVNLQVAAREPLLAESDLGEQVFRRFVRGQAGGFDAVQPERGKDERYQRARGVEHVTLAREALADPVAERAALRDTAPHVGERAAPHQRIAVFPEDEERVGRILPRLLLVALDAPAICALAEL